MRTLTIIFIACFFLSACQEKKSDSQLFLIPPAETVERVKVGNFDYTYAQFKNQEGEELSEEEKKLLNQGKMAKDYYEDENGVIQEVHVRPLTLDDKLIEVQRRALINNPMMDFESMKIDCNDQDSIYSKVLELDQEVRKKGGEIDAIDFYNQRIVISAIQQCGWNVDQLFTVWLIIYHAPTNVIAYYYPSLKQFANQGYIQESSMATMEDRLLMTYGYKQIYGTQIMDRQLYDLENPERVNERRTDVGLGPIEVYLKSFDIDFEEEKDRMEREN